MISLAALGTLFAPAVCQNAPESDGVARLGFLRLNTGEQAAQRRFWVGALGARPIKLGPVEALELPGVFILLNEVKPLGGTAGSVVDHVGFKVRDLGSTVERATAAQAAIVSRNDKQAMLLAPDDLRVELTADPALDEPVAMHHIHFYAHEVAGMRQWYVDTFGAIRGKRGNFEAADLPGVNLSFSPADAALPGTQGRALDRIGFQVQDLDALIKRLEKDGIPWRKFTDLGVAAISFTDPWGTYIEVTEALASR
jgi:catechol 2,3-dioxygenase-like lactoylglutathione lyase family enzyme